MSKTEIKSDCLTVVLVIYFVKLFFFRALALLPPGILWNYILVILLEQLFVLIVELSI